MSEFTFIYATNSLMQTLIKVKSLLVAALILNSNPMVEERQTVFPITQQCLDFQAKYETRLPISSIVPWPQTTLNFFISKLHFFRVFYFWRVLILWFSVLE